MEDLPALSRPTSRSVAFMDSGGGNGGETGDGTEFETGDTGAAPIKGIGVDGTMTDADEAGGGELMMGVAAEGALTRAGVEGASEAPAAEDALDLPPRGESEALMWIASTLSALELAQPMLRTR